MTCSPNLHMRGGAGRICTQAGGGTRADDRLTLMPHLRSGPRSEGRSPREQGSAGRPRRRQSGSGINVRWGKLVVKILQNMGKNY